jgi:acyl-CoA synthetase (AMP-forming)/AMP-acid ligase II
MSAPYNLGDLIDRSRDLAKVALIDLGGDGGEVREYTYAALDRLCSGIARALLARGFRRGERVAILSANRTEYLAAYYGAMRAGIVAVPVNHRFPRERIAFVLRDAGAKLLFCDRERRHDAPADLPTVVFGDPDASGFDAFLDPGVFDAVVPEPGEAAMILYTSGSTGRPKGVVLSHQSHLWTVQVRMEGHDLAHHRYLIAAPLYHMNALALSKLACAAHAAIVLMPQFSAPGYVDAIGRYRTTFLTAVPPMIAMMLRERDRLARIDLSSVEFLRMGSAPASPGLLAAIAEAMPRARIIHAYGTTEGGPVVFGPHPDGIPQPPSSVGYPHRRVALRLADGDNLDAVQGVLQMKSPALMSSYHNRPDLAPPFTADGFYVTGDVMRRDEHGFHYFVGRADDMFVCGGENIYPGEVEKLLETHPDVVQACVVPVGDEIKGQKPVAFCVPRPGTTPAEAQLREYTLVHGPAYAHPRRIWLVDRLLLGPTGKIDRKGLAALARQRVGEAAVCVT